MRVHRLVGRIILVGWVVSACGSQWPEQATAASLARVVREAGAEVSQSNETSPDAFGVAGTTLLVNRQPVWVYSFADASAREAAAGALSPDGMSFAGEELAWPSRPSIWGVDRLLVVYAGIDGATILLLDGLLGDPLTLSAAEAPEPYPPSVAAGIGAVADELGVAPQSIEVTSFEPRTWPDSCLGLPEGDEVCTPSPVPGWSIVLMVDSSRITLRTDDIGAIVRREP